MLRWKNLNNKIKEQKNCINSKTFLNISNHFVTMTHTHTHKHFFDSIINIIFNNILLQVFNEIFLLCHVLIRQAQL